MPTWKSTDIKSREKLMYSPVSNFSFSFVPLVKWGECRINPKNDISLCGRLGRQFKTSTMDLAISSRITISDEQERKLIDHFNHLNEQTKIHDIIFDDSLIPIAYKLFKETEEYTKPDKWFGLTTYIDQFIPMSFESIQTALSQENLTQGFPISIDKQLFYIYKNTPTFALLTLILDVYADRQIPDIKGTSHNEITQAGTQLMMQILKDNLQLKETVVKEMSYMFKILKEKQFLPHIVHTFNDESLKKMKTETLKTNFNAFAKSLAKKIEKEEKESVSEEPTVKFIKKEIPEKYKPYIGTLVSLNTIVNADLDNIQIINMLSAAELIIPDCIIEFKIDGVIFTLFPENIAYTFIQDQEFYIIINRSGFKESFKTGTILEMEQTLETKLDMFERVNLCYRNQCKISSYIQKQIDLIDK